MGSNGSVCGNVTFTAFCHLQYCFTIVRVAVIYVTNSFLFSEIELNFIRKHSRQVQAKIITARVGGIGQTFSKCGWDWSGFQWEWAGTVKLSVKMGRIGVGEGLVKLSDGVHRIGQNAPRCRIKKTVPHTSACLLFLSLILVKCSTGIPGEHYISFLVLALSAMRRMSWFICLPLLLIKPQSMKVTQKHSFDSLCKAIP